MTAAEILIAIEKLDNEQRWILLDKMYDLYYNSRENEKGSSNVTEY
ncbi:hypothetical protein [Metabacillus idriensis]|nr:hypothetical protein [Metabacillus idriensis]